MSRRFFWGIFNLVVLVALGAGMFFALQNRQDIADWWKLQNYDPPAEIVSLADKTTMHGVGRDMFYVSEPRIVSREEFNRSCTDHGEESIILGCYKLQRIYLFDITDKKLDGVEEVTAAHEMLHAAYERMSGNDKNRIHKMIDDVLPKIRDAELDQLIKLYRQAEPGEYYNELHSIIGSEYSSLGKNLEQHYSKYFSNRAKVVEYADSYKKVFLESKAKIETLSKQIESLRGEIEDNNKTLSEMDQQLRNDSAKLESLRASNPQAYNQAVPKYNQDIREYNALVATTKTLVDKFNTLIEDYNNEVAAQNGLYASLDSNFESR